jgi:hypothetical protein
MVMEQKYSKIYFAIEKIDCDFKCHHECSKNAPHNCGIDMKALYRTLEAVVKQKTQENFTSKINIPHNPEIDFLKEFFFNLLKTSKKKVEKNFVFQRAKV